MPIVISSINAIALTLTPAQVESTLHHPNVASVHQVQRFHYTAAAAWGIDRVNQRKLPLDNSAANSLTGYGVDVYMVDSGIEITHPQFEGMFQSRSHLIYLHTYWST